jgi:dephospho-CoA kinase
MSLALRLGLTGGIGSGKSTVASMLEASGAMVLDADGISRQTTGAGGAAIQAIAEAFGTAFIDTHGAVDRNKMRALVFSDPQARKRLEAIIHPLVSAETQRLLDCAMSPCVVLDIPLLVESGRWRSRLDAVLVVDCEEATQMARVVARNGLPADEIKRIMASQASRAQRLACADAVVFNEGLTLSELRAEVGLLAHRFGL